ncbi:MAG TPA: N-acetyltransferase [Pilimelia sp.]|nr:N-acetyltransferase [Pilimelia sp.]
MIKHAALLAGRDAVLAATGHHPYVRLTTGGVGTVRGYVRDGVTAWTGPGPWGPVGCALGDADGAARLFAALAASGGLGGARWLHLPRATGSLLSRHLPISHHDDWEFRWADQPPPRHPAEDRVVPLGPDDEPDVVALLDRAHASSTTRPGDPRVRAWYGIRASEGARLLACGGDRSRGGVGFLAGLTVDGAAQGRGLGTALTAAMTRRLLSAYGCVALGVMADNRRAIGIYERLGFTAVIDRSSVSLVPSQI